MPQTFNRYSYVTNSPLTQIDPSGMFGISPDGSPLGGIGGLQSFSLNAESTDESEEQQQQYPQPGVLASDTEIGVCSIELVIYGPKSAGNELTFPTENQDLGSMEGTIQGNEGWFS